MNEELEDGEVDDGGGGDVNSGLNRHAGEGAGRSGIVGHQLLLPPKSAPADAEKREKGKAPHTLTSEMDASAQATETTDPGRMANFLWCFAHRADCLCRSRSNSREHQDGILVGGLLFGSLRRSAAGYKSIDKVTNVAGGAVYLRTWNGIWQAPFQDALSMRSLNSRHQTPEDEVFGYPCF